MFQRYAILVTLAVASLYALVSTGNSSSNELMLVDTGATGSVGEPSFAYWLLAAIAGLTSFSLLRFVVFGIPSMVGTWYESHKEWLYTIVLGGLVCGVYYWM
jgi:hypothetical protein